LGSATGHQGQREDEARVTDEDGEHVAILRYRHLGAAIGLGLVVVVRRLF
jgi:hypothetical protein